MSVETESAPAERVYDRTLIAGGRRLAAWGPGFLTKAEGLWATPHGVYVIGERAEGDARVSFRIVEEGEAVETLRAHGQAWRAARIEKAAAAEAAPAADGDTAAEPATGEDAAAEG